MIGRMGKLARPIDAKEDTTTQNNWGDGYEGVVQ